MSRAKRIEEKLIDVLQQGVDASVFPGAVSAVAWRENNEWQRVLVAVGRHSTRSSPVVQADTIYDLASLTKSVFAMSVLRLVDRRVLSLDTEIEGMSLESLLTHRSGLAAWVPFYETCPFASSSDQAKAWVIDQISNHRQPKNEGTVEYSDLGYILAGHAIEEASGISLSQMVQDEISSLLGIDLFFATQRDGDWKDRCAPTSEGGWRKRELLGEVNDDNCALLGGVSAHAGLFGTASDVLIFGQSALDSLSERSTHWNADTLRHAITKRSGGSHRLGWDGKSEKSAAGTKMSERTFGHLGYTGTSLWCDPDTELVTVLLSNRVYPDDSSKTIRQFRPSFHDTVFAAYEG